MTQVIHYQLAEPRAKYFKANSWPEILEEIAAWLRQNADISVLSIRVDTEGDGESMTVFYESLGEVEG